MGAALVASLHNTHTPLVCAATFSNIAMNASLAQVMWQTMVGGSGSGLRINGKLATTCINKSICHGKHKAPIMFMSTTSLPDCCMLTDHTQSNTMARGPNFRTPAAARRAQAARRSPISGHPLRSILYCQCLGVTCRPGESIARFVVPMRAVARQCGANTF